MGKELSGTAEIERDGVTLRGMAISNGLAAGPAFVSTVDPGHRLASYDIAAGDVDIECNRLRRNVRRVRRQLASLHQRVRAEIDQELALVFEAHQEMLGDDQLLEELNAEIREERVSAGEAVIRVFRRWERRFRAMPAVVSQTRADDLLDLQQRLLSSLSGQGPDWTHAIPEGAILIVDRLLPSVAAALPGRGVVGVAAVSSSPASHAALLMHESGLPLVAQLEGLFESVQAGDVVLLDGVEGTVTVRPSPAARSDFDRRTAEYAHRVRLAQARAADQAVTRDGVRVEVMANIGCRDDAELAAVNGAEGIGLFRIEQIYLKSVLPPSEDELTDILASVVEPIGTRPLRVRLLDVGADKQVPYLTTEPEANPALGCRGIRFLFQHAGLMRTQIRAVLRLSQRHSISIMAPMVVLRDDILQVRKMIEREAEAMGIEDVPPFGIMIETPAAALCIGDWIGDVDFISFGTNDLTQYTMAADRENARVVHYFQDSHPAVMRLLQMACEAAAAVPRCICGDLAAHPDAVEPLLRLGVRALSVPPPVIPLIKQRIREIDLSCPAETNPPYR